MTGVALGTSELEVFQSSPHSSPGVQSISNSKMRIDESTTIHGTGDEQLRLLKLSEIVNNNVGDLRSRVRPHRKYC